MLKVITFIALVSMVSSMSISTPLLAELNPQPAEAPASTKHAGYVEALTPVLKATPLIATAAIIPSALTTVQHLPLAYASNYLTYGAPVEVSHYRIAF